MTHDYTGWLGWVYDWQTLIAGIGAIFGGWLAYLAGVKQAATARETSTAQIKATLQAAEQQVAAVNAELEHLKAERTEEDRRAREDLLASLEIEAAKIPMLVTLMCEAARKRHTIQIVMNAEVYKISADVLREAKGISTLVHGNIRIAVNHLLASIDQLNALIEVNGRGELTGDVLIAALLKVHEQADELQGALGEYGGDRRIIRAAE